MNRVAGIVLCGGKSSRMGRPKAWLPFGPETLLQRTVRVLATVLDPVVVVAAPGQEVPPLPESIRIVRDAREYLGPLNGLVTGLTALEGIADAAFLSACDAPFLSVAFVTRVVAHLGDAAACLPETGGFLHPLAAAYRVNVLPEARRLIENGRLRPVFLTEHVPTIILKAADFADIAFELRSLRNVNTVEEYEAALRELGQDPVELG